MTARFLVMTAAVPLAGLWIGGFPSIRVLNALERWMLYFAAGFVTLAIEMVLMSIAGVPWSIVLLLALPLIAAIPGWRRSVDGARSPRPRWELALAVAAIIVVILFVDSGAATNFDLLLFWGPKAQHFGLVRAVDPVFMRENFLMHPDYPTLYIGYLAWTMQGGARLDWWGAAATMPLFLVLSTIAVYGFSRSRLSPAFAALFASTVGILYVLNSLGGNAEPPMVFFETLAVAAIVTGAGDVAVAVALIGAVLTKREGLAFAVVAFALHVVIAGEWRKRMRAGIAVAAVMLGWIAYCAHYHLIVTYNLGAEVALSFARVLHGAALVWSQFSLGVGYLPWLAVLALIFCGRARAALPYVAATLAYCLILVYQFARMADADAFALWSVSRLLISAYVFLFFGAVAAIRAVETPAAVSPR
jgi:hypothetical protein